MARVSICSSVLNQSELLKGMIDSVRSQTFEDWELVLVDDGSTEDISGLVASYADARIKLHAFPKNRGVPHGINFALAQVTGEYIGVLSADERIEKDKLKFQVEYLDKETAIDAVWGLPYNGHLGERPLWEQYALRAHNRSREAWVRTLMGLEHIPIGGASMLMRKSALDDIGLFDPQHFTVSDMEWFVRFFKKHDGAVLPYRWAWEEGQPNALRKTVTAERFQADMKKVHDKHAVKPPKVLAKVTVAIPVRNMAAYIAATLNSVLAQTWEHFEIMVLDDASTDNTADIVRSFADPRIKLFQFTENMGCIEAQNQMLARCETPFFVVLAADDTIEPTFLERCVTEFARDPWLELVASQTDFIDVGGAPYTGEHVMKSIRKAANLPRDQWLQLLWHGNVYFGCGMYRTQALKQVNGWDSSVGVLSDYDMYLKLLQREQIHIIEEDLTHTRIHGENRSLLKTYEQRRDLKKHYRIIKGRYYQPQMKVVIATPFYELRGFSPYISSLAATVKMLTGIGVEHAFWELSGDSYVDRAKNTIMNKFLEDPDATDLFMIDSDMQWNAEAFVRMLMLPEELVVGSYPQKNSWGKWTSLPVVVQEEGKSHPVGQMLSDGTGLLQAAYLAGGFMRIKRSALERFQAHHKDLTYRDSSADPGEPERVYTEFCTCEIKDGLRWGEDRVMGKRFKEIGVDAWIYPNVDFGHYGIKGWMGNFDTYLRNPDKQAALAHQPSTERIQ